MHYSGKLFGDRETINRMIVSFYPGALVMIVDQMRMSGSTRGCVWNNREEDAISQEDSSRFGYCQGYQRA